jgi:hypothetical protein
MHAVRSCELTDRTSLHHMRFDQIPGLVHEKTPSRRCLRCPDTCVAYVVAAHTTRRTLCDELIAGASVAIAGRAGSGPVIRVHAAEHACLVAAWIGRPRPALLDLDVPALLKAAHRERDEEQLQRHDQQRQDAE